MKKNIGKTDRIIRYCIAAILILLSALQIFKGAIEIVALIIAALMIITATIRFCPLYCPLSINTKTHSCCKKSYKKQ